MEINKKLAITIPTYNRVDFLDYSLSIHIPILRTFNIPIYISDNASTDNTQEIVAKWQGEYEFLFYHCNKENLGADVNFENAIKLPSTDYVWIVGDTNFFSKNVIIDIINSIDNNKDIDVVVLNANNRIKNFHNKVYIKHDELLNELGWHMTLVSSLIYSRKVILNSSFKDFYRTCFLQTGIIFDYFSRCVDFRLLWLGSTSVGSIKLNGIKKISWQKQTFEIWLVYWPEFIFSLKDIYPFGSKLKAIKDHNNISGVFSVRNLISLRREGFFSLDVYRKYRNYFGVSLGCKRHLIVFLLSIIPKFIFDFKLKNKQI